MPHSQKLIEPAISVASEKPRRRPAADVPGKRPSSHAQQGGHVVAIPKRGTVPLERMLDIFDFAAVFAASGTERIDAIKRGVPASDVGRLAEQMKISTVVLTKRLGIAHASMHRQAKDNATLPMSQSERMIGLSKLIGQVETMVAQSGDETGFCAAVWLACWLSRANPALGGELPADYLDTIQGQEVLGAILAQMQSGAYA